MKAYRTLYWNDVSEGDALPIFSKVVISTNIVYGAMVSRDFQPAHHDRDVAQKQGNKDIFMNILTTNGWTSRYLTDWTGPTGDIKKLSFALKASCYPGDLFVWNGKVKKKYVEGEQHLVEVEYSAKVPAGDHCIGTAIIALPVKDG